MEIKESIMSACKVTSGVSRLINMYLGTVPNVVPLLFALNFEYMSGSLSVQLPESGPPTTQGQHV